MATKQVMIGVNNRAYKGATYQLLRFRSRLKGGYQNGHLGGRYGVSGGIRAQVEPVHPFIGQDPPTHTPHRNKKKGKETLTSLANLAIILSCNDNPSPTSPTTSAKLLSISSIRIHTESSTKFT